jgi:hypothetical protein
MSGAGHTPKSLPGMFTCVLKGSIRSSNTDRRYKVPKSKRDPPNEAALLACRRRMDYAIGKTAGRLFGPEPDMKQGVINEPAIRSSRRSVEKDGGRRLTHPRLPAAIRDCRQAVRWCRGSCQSMPLRPRPRPRHHLANRPARRLHVSLGGFGMCNGSCADYTTYARLCRPGAGQIAGQLRDALPRALHGLVTCPCKLPPRGVRVRPCEGRTDEASQVYGRTDYWRAAGA